MTFDLNDYKDVPARIADFKAKHPEGCLRPADPLVPYRIEILDGRTFVVFVAAAHRTPDDPCPGIGTAYEPFPGKTPYTRDSELQNAETSAWGRAIVAVLASESKSIASQEDVRNRRADQDEAELPPPPAQGWPTLGDQQEAWNELRTLSAAIEDDDNKALLRAWVKENVPTFGALTATKADLWREQLSMATPAETNA